MWPTACRRRANGSSPMRRASRPPSTCRVDRGIICGGRMTDRHRLLLIKPSSLGDIVHAMPTLTALRTRFPQAEVTWLVKRQWAPLVEVIRGVDRVCAVEEGVRGWLGQVPGLRATRFDLVIDLQGLFRSGAMAWLSGCGRRIGFANAREGGSLFYTQRVAVPTASMHAVDRYLLVAEAVGAERPAEPRFEFADRPEDRQTLEGLLTGVGVTPASSWIAMNVSARWETKRWPPQHFAEAADRLSQARALPILFIGGPAERPDSQAVISLMRRKAGDLTGQTPVRLRPDRPAQDGTLRQGTSRPVARGGLQPLFPTTLFPRRHPGMFDRSTAGAGRRSEEHTSELQSPKDLV